MSSDLPAFRAKNLILERAEGITEVSKRDLGLGMILAALAVLTEIYPPKLTDNEISLIRENYPDATDELIKERAMSETGTKTAIEALIVAAQIAMDYSPLSNFKDQYDSDMALDREILDRSQKAVKAVFNEALENGLSPFGTASLIIGVTTIESTKAGLTCLQLLRPLLEMASERIEAEPSPEMATLTEDAALARLAQTLGISKAAAKKMVSGVFPHR